MVYTNISGSAIKGPYQEIKKDKERHMSPRRQQQQQQQQRQQQQQQQSSRKDDKYGSWGPIFKNKENFIDMHTCWSGFQRNVFSTYDITCNELTRATTGSETRRKMFLLRGSI